MQKTRTDLEEKISTLLIGVDTLLSGDALHESGMYHMIADTWFSGQDAPEIYYDDFSKKVRDFEQKEEGENVLENKTATLNFIEKYGLRDLVDEVKVGANELEGDDKTNALNLINSLDVMLRTVLSKNDDTKVPEFDEKYLAATGNVLDSVNLADPSEAREYFRKTLSDAGYETSNSRNLIETFHAWRDNQVLLSSLIVKDNVKKINKKLLKVMRENVFSKLDFGIKGHKKDLSDVLFDGHKFETISGVSFTGSSIYQGKEIDGKPALIGLFEYNVDHPLTKIGMYHLCGHEIIAHYINAAVKDLLYRDGKLDFLSTTGTMCTPDVVFQEGWAQNIFEVLYGDREKAGEVYGEDLLVTLAHSDLEDFGKHNASILFQRENRSIEEVRGHIQEDCLQDEAIVKKLSGVWAKDDIVGPMYGPAYLVGRRIVNNAIKKYGNIPVSEIGYHLKGSVDIKTFQDKVERL